MSRGRTHLTGFISRGPIGIRGNDFTRFHRKRSETNLICPVLIRIFEKFASSALLWLSGCANNIYSCIVIAFTAPFSLPDARFHALPLHCSIDVNFICNKKSTVHCRLAPLRKINLIYGTNYLCLFTIYS